MATQFDLVILNGRVMDPETKLDAIRNVGVNGDKRGDRPLGDRRHRSALRRRGALLHSVSYGRG